MTSVRRHCVNHIRFKRYEIRKLWSTRYAHAAKVRRIHTGDMRRSCGPGADHQTTACGPGFEQQPATHAPSTTDACNSESDAAGGRGGLVAFISERSDPPRA